MFDPIELAETCPTAQAFENEVLHELARGVGCDAAFFWTNGDRPTVYNFDARGRQALLRVVTAPGDYEPELRPIKRAALAAGGVAIDSEVLGDTAMRRARYFRDVAGPAGGRHSMLAYLSLRGTPIGGLMLGRSGTTFRGQDVDQVRSLLARIAVGRASFGVPPYGVDLPLPAGPEPRSWLARMARQRGPVTLASVESASGGLAIRDRDGYREMVATRGTSEMVWTRAKVSEPYRSGWPYIELFHVAVAAARDCRRALFIGCGGAVAVRQFARRYPGMELDLVESDPTVIELARSWYSLDRIPRLTVHIGDGAAFVAGAPPECWDVVIADAYGAGELATGFCRRAFFASVRRALRPGGALAFNVVGTLAGASAVQDVVRLASQELSDIRVLPVVEAGEEASLAWALRNVVVLASRSG